MDRFADGFLTARLPGLAEQPLFEVLQRMDRGDLRARVRELIHFL